MINQVRRLCKQQLRISVFLLHLTWPGLNVDIRGSLHKCSWFDLLWLAVVVCSFISIPISRHLTTLHTGKFDNSITVYPPYRAIFDTEQSYLFTYIHTFIPRPQGAFQWNLWQIRFTLLEEAWTLVKWKTLIYAIERQGTELKDKFLFCNLTNLPCRCCLDGELSSFEHQWSLRWLYAARGD